jgi:hypothetical protein
MSGEDLIVVEPAPFHPEPSSDDPVALRWSERACPDLARYRPPDAESPDDPRWWVLLTAVPDVLQPAQLGLAVVQVLEAVGDALLVHHVGLVVPEIDPAARDQLADYCAAARVDISAGRRPLRFLGLLDLGRLLLRRWYWDDGILVGFDLARSLVLVAEHVTLGRGQHRERATLGLPGWGALTEGRDQRVRWHVRGGCPQVSMTPAGALSLLVGFSAARQPDPAWLRARDGLGPGVEVPRWGRRARAAPTVELAAAGASLDGLATREAAAHLESFGVEAIEWCAVEATRDGVEHVLRLAEAHRQLLTALLVDARRLNVGSLVGLHSAGSVMSRLLYRFGLTPPLAAQDLDGEEYRRWMLAFRGGRNEAPPAPRLARACDVDAGSAYPSAMHWAGWWSLMTARSRRVEECAEDLRELCSLPRDELLDAVHDPLTAARLGHVRAQVRFDGQPGPWNIDVGDVIYRSRLVHRPLYGVLDHVPGPDVLAATLEAGRPPEILAATRIVADGQPPELPAVEMLGIRLEGGCDPMVELARERARRKATGQPQDRRLARLLRVVDNSAYGQCARVDVRPDGEVPGPWFAPWIAATATGWVRCLLVGLSVESSLGWLDADTDGASVELTGSDDLEWLREICSRYDRWSIDGTGRFFTLDERASHVAVFGPKRRALCREVPE